MCCEHNRCPQRPRWWLYRFQTRPWLCPQCKRLWCTEQSYDGWGDTDGWEWIEIPVAEYVEGMSNTPEKKEPGDRCSASNGDQSCALEYNHDGQCRFVPDDELPPWPKVIYDGPGN